jgi:hypothetical protein
LVCHLRRTFLQLLQVLPEDVAHESWGAGGERVFAHGADVLALHPELVQGDAFEGELLHGPLQPVGDVVLGPLTRICNQSQNQKRSQHHLQRRKVAKSFFFLDVVCQTQGRLKLIVELYVSEKSVINSIYFISEPSYFSW